MARSRLWTISVLLAVWLGSPGVRPARAQSEPPADVTNEELRQLVEALEADTEDSPAEGPPDPMSSGPLGRASSAMQSMNPAISVILDAALGYFSTDEPLQLGAHDPNQTGFTFQQLEMAIGAAVDPFFRFDANLVFAQFGVEVEEAYATTLALPGNLQLRAGQFLTRVGRVNSTHPHTWSFVDQPIVYGKLFGGEGSRGLGLEVSWLAPLPWFVELVGSASQADGACCARSFFGADNPGIDRPEDFLYTAALDQFFSFGDDVGLLWGLSAQFGPNPTGRDTRTAMYGTDLYLRYRPLRSANRMSLSWQTEAFFRTRQIPRDVLQDWGLYTQLVYGITPRWEVGGRYEYVTGVRDDYLDPDWDSHRQRASLQATFYPSHFSRVRLQGNWDDPDFRDEAYFAALLNLEVLVGAHGAHSY